MPAALDNNTIQKIIEIYTKENIFAKEIARRLDLNEATVCKYLKQNGIEMKSFSDLKRTPQIVNQIIELYQSGYSEDKIENIVGLCRTTIRKILRDNNISIRDNTCYRTYSVDENYFEKLDTMNKCYVLGFLYADGNVSKNKYNIQLSLQKGDREILEKISKDMKSNKPLMFRNQSKYNEKTGLNSQDQWALVIHCKKIHQDLAKWGVIPNKTHIVTYPDFLTDDQQASFLRGAIDGDGCIHPCKNNFAAVDINGTYDFCLGAKNVIESFLDIHCSIFLSNNYGGRTTYRIAINGRRQVKTFLDWLYKDAELYLARKYRIYCQDYKDYDKDNNNEVA